MASVQTGQHSGNSDIQKALALVDMGVPVWACPLKANGDPIPPRGWEQIKPSRAQVERWKEGMALCATMGVVFDGLDWDAYKAGAKASFGKMDAALGENGPEVFGSVATASGGRHFLIQKLDIGSHNGFRTGLDLKGGKPDGTSRGFLFIPPTVRPSRVTGNPEPYRWRKDCTSPNGSEPCVPLARFVMDTTPAIGGDPLSHDPDELRDDCLSAPDGGQRLALLRYAQWMRRRGYSLGAQKRELRSVMQEMTQYPSKHGPWYPARGRNPDKWIQTVLDDKSIPDAEPGELGELRPQHSHGNLLAGIRKGNWLDEQTFAPLAYVLPGLVAEGSALCAGRPKIGKSLMLLRWGLEAARGGIVFGERVEQRDVLYLALEDGDRRMQTRCRQLLESQPIPARFSYKLEVEPHKLIQTIGAWLDGHPAGLVIIDTLGRANEPAQRGETTYDRDYRIAVSLKKQADDHPGSAVIVNHHTRKADAEDFVDVVSGTLGTTGGVDTIIVLTRKRGGSEGVLRITGRDVPEGEYALLMEYPTGWRLDGESLLEASVVLEQRSDNRGDRLLSVVEFVVNSSAAFPSGVTAADVVKAVPDVPQKQASVYLNRAHEAGDIRRIKRGVYGPNVKVRIGRSRSAVPS